VLYCTTVTRRVVDEEVVWQRRVLDAVNWEPHRLPLKAETSKLRCT